MGDTEVENILQEIRERVYAEQEALAGSRSIAVSDADVSTSNGGSPSADSLARLESYLTTTGRAWDRLPPVVSNRSGAIARAELWLKNNFKRATRWYAWEQINFNAAVHHALHDLVQIISVQEKALAELNRARAESETRLAEWQQAKSEMQSLRSQLDAQRASLAAQQKLIVEQHTAIQAFNAALKDRDVAIENRVQSLVNELRERTQLLDDQQRVSYKQLALETREAAIIEERARRKTEALLEDLQRRIDG
jgi:DNA repair exonuclease SbcCD ATPase subunit